MKWFRSYRGTPERAKFRVIANRASQSGMGGGSVHEDRVDGAVFLTDVLSVWWVLLDDAANASHWGYVTRDATYIATVLELGVDEVRSVLNEMTTEGMIEPPGSRYLNAIHHVVNWEQYQYVSDTDPTAAVRQKRYRERRTRNALLTRTDTDTDTEKKDIGQKTNGSSHPEHADASAKRTTEKEFLEFWALHPKKKSKQTARKAYAKARRSVSHETIMTGLRRAIPGWRDPQFIPYPATWLNAGSWEDEPEAKPSFRSLGIV